MTDDLARKVYRDVMGVEPPAALTPAEQFAFGTVWSSSGITRRERWLSAFVCVSWAQDEDLMTALAYGALKNGDFTVNEMLEWVLHFAIYCGWPKASTAESAITAAYDRLREERGEPVTDLPTIDPTDAHLGLTDWDDRLAAGRETFLDVNLIDAPATNTYYRNSGIVGFVFGHLWRRPALTRRERRFITVPCVLVENARIPIWSHTGSALESGDISQAEMGEILQTVAAYAGFELAARGQREAEEALARISNGGGLLAGALPQ